VRKKIKLFFEKIFRKVSRHQESNVNGLRDSIEELIDESPQHEDFLNLQEKALLTNVLRLQDLTADDVMIPRADIVAIDSNTPPSELIKHFIQIKHSRLLLYRETLDDVVGFLHIRSVLAHPKNLNIEKEIEQVLFISPSMRILDLLKHMQTTHSHMAIVVDEFGGVDGLITMSNLVDEIIKGLNDMEGTENQAEMTRMSDGSYLVNARVNLEDFEQTFGHILTDDERQKEDIDTLAGLVVSIAGHVPKRKEIITHSSGVDFEVLDADPRRIKRLRVYREENTKESREQ